MGPRLMADAHQDPLWIYSLFDVATLITTSTTISPPSTWASPTTVPLQAVPAKVRLALQTFHMKASRHLLDQMSAFRTMFPPLLLPNGLHLLSLLVLRAKAARMLPRSTVSARPSFARAHPDVAVDVPWRHECAAVPVAAVERIRGRGFEFE